MVKVMNKTNYRFAGFTLLVAVVMFLFLDSGTVMNVDGMVRPNGWMSFHGWGWLITSGAIGIFIFITFLLFRKNLLRDKRL